MDQIDLAIRGAAITLLILLAVLMWRARISLEGRVAILAVAATKSAFLMTHSASALPIPPVLEANLLLLASFTPTALTWLIVTIFLDPPGRRWPWLVASALVSGALYAHYTWPELLFVCAPLGVSLYASLLGLALWNARDDLVECRCRARPAFAAAIAGLSLLLTAIQAVGVAELGSPLYALAQGAGTLAVVFAFALWILRPDAELWPGPVEPEAQPTKPTPDLSRDNRLIATLGQAMEEGVWREEGLTIGRLAQHLNVPEHRVRRAINQGMGYRNFSSFINAARIDAARRMLSDPAQAGVTVLEIAYSVGFASLGPFNRAFRSEMSMSPTEFRRDYNSSYPSISVEDEKSGPFLANLH
ncbi:MAG: AraC family transcriptional regulator [Pseudomonadota bacterium]